MLAQVAPNAGKQPESRGLPRVPVFGIQPLGMLKRAEPPVLPGEGQMTRVAPDRTKGFVELRDDGLRA